MLFGLALMYDPGAVSCGSVVDARSCRYIDAITSMSFPLLRFPSPSYYEQVLAVPFYFARYLVSITRNEPHVSVGAAITPALQLHSYYPPAILPPQIMSQTAKLVPRTRRVLLLRPRNFKKRKIDFIFNESHSTARALSCRLCI